MKKFKKIKILFCIILLIFNLAYRPKPVKADAGVASFGGMTLIALNPEIWPVVLVGLAAALLLGYTITNWDDISAFGAAVVEQLEIAGHSVDEFVSGTSVKIDATFKKAVKKASVGEKNSISRYIDKNSYTYSNGFRVLLGSHKINAGYVLVFPEGRNIFTGNLEKGKYFRNIKYNPETDFLGTSLSVSMEILPLPDKFNPLFILQV
ncbi:hypothetical protein [Streptococcus marmotae]|uniref:hypothetical protein n=1 Tax=Streptococcus marmotae TaxID=1825069 RepID=UPI00082AA289|nr:hypothetical protein [Streptococcus marmotae]